MRIIMDNVIITPAEVIRLAFADGGYVAPEAIGEGDITAAVSRWVEPVAGAAVCAAVASGRYPDLKPHLATAAAACTRLEVQPRLNVRTGQAGLTEPAGIFAAAAAESARIELMRSLKVQAHAMLLRLTEYLDENAASIPEYDPRANVLKRCRTDGGFVQIF